MSEEHKPFINTPKQLIVVSVLALVIPVALALLLSQWVTGGSHVNAKEAASAVVNRIKPSGSLKMFDPSEPAPVVAVAAPVANAAPKAGPEVYKNACSVCHDSGAANAPKFADKAQWAARVGQGLEGLVANAIKGKGAMPAKGGNPALQDAEIKNAVEHMLAAVK